MTPKPDRTSSAAKLSRRVNITLALTALGFLVVIPLEVWFRV